MPNGIFMIDETIVLACNEHLKQRPNQFLMEAWLATHNRMSKQHTIEVISMRNTSLVGILMKR